MTFDHNLDREWAVRNQFLILFGSSNLKQISLMPYAVLWAILTVRVIRSNQGPKIFFYDFTFSFPSKAKLYINDYRRRLITGGYHNPIKSVNGEFNELLHNQIKSVNGEFSEIKLPYLKMWLIKINQHSPTWPIDFIKLAITPLIT